MQVSFERTLGTIAGGTLGYVTILVGHRLLEASDALVAGMPHSCTHASIQIYAQVGRRESGLGGWAQAPLQRQQTQAQHPLTTHAGPGLRT